MYTIQQRSTRYWTFDRVREEALKYKTRTAFRNGNVSAYDAAYRNRWLNDICGHMPPGKRNHGYWTFNRVQKEALKYKTRTEFFRGNMSAYTTAQKKGWLNDICGHMPLRKRKNRYWTFNRVRKEALKYKTKTAFRNGNISAYGMAYRNGWLDQICSHMPTFRKKKGYWNFENVKTEALKYKTRTAFYNGNMSAYLAACRKKWLDTVCQHMISGYELRSLKTK